MRIVVGLGNPGRRYAETRHNVGFRAVERLAARLGASFHLDSVGEDAQIARAICGGESIVIAKPMTWMNRSGLAATRLAAMYGASPGEFIVAYDDVALPLARIRVRPAGRSAGQKGMESILRELATSEVPRVRMGILGAAPAEDLADYVLEPFLSSEREQAEEMIERASLAILCVLEKGVPQAMNEYNVWGGDSP
jgi:PTH1 family peptidyl-tRNA hydrolase